MKNAVTVCIDSLIDGERIYQEGPGEYSLRSDGTHWIAYTDYSGNMVTRCGFFADKQVLLLHRTGAIEGDINVADLMSCH